MQRAIIILTIILGFTGTPYCQHVYKTESSKAINSYEQGLKYFNIKNYTMAQTYLNGAIAADINFQDAYLVLAELFWEQGKYNEAIGNYSKALAIDSLYYPRGYLNKGELEIKSALYSDALVSFRKYIELVPGDTKYKSHAEKGIQQANFAIRAVANPVEFKPINLGPNINSTDDEYWPSLSADEQTLIITRMLKSYDIAKGNTAQEDFFVSTFAGEGWGPMKNVGTPLNTPDNEGAQTISAAGKLMVYTVCNRPGVIGRCDLYSSQNDGQKWSLPKNMGAPLNSKFKETQPSLSADGNILYFSCNRDGGKGGLDLWVSALNENGSWQTPTNLGDSINTSGNEQSPFIHPDNKTLYFSSDGHTGLGGYDIFVARRNEAGDWTNVQNLGYPINTNRDEMGLIVNAKGTEAYYSSAMKPENGQDIYRFELYEQARPAEVSYLKGEVFDEKTRRRMKAKFELYSLKTGELVGQSYSDERTGEFFLCIPTNQDYMLNVALAGYLFYSDNFSLQGVYHLDKPFQKDVPLKPIETGKTIVLKNIFYETGSYILKPESKYELDQIFNFLQTNPAIKIEISGHTDNVGTEEYNQTLSASRAKSVVTYLTDKGIAPTRLTNRGYGFTTPLDSNETPEGRANNRRTELKVE